MFNKLSKKIKEKQDIKKYKLTLKKLNEFYINQINKNKDIIIESFVEYYGEKYRDTIIRKYNDTVYAWGFCEDTFIENEPIIKNVSTSLNIIQGKINECFGSELKPNQLKLIYNDEMNLSIEHDENNIFKFLKMNHNSQIKYLKKITNSNVTDEYLKQIISCISIFEGIYNSTINLKNQIYPIYDLLEKKDLIDYDLIIGATDEFEEEATQKNEIPEHAAGYVESNYGKKNYIYFSIAQMIDSKLIHEINHALTTSKLFKEDKYIDIVCKSGLWVMDSNVEHCIDEITNELSARKITEIFKRRGGNIFGDVNYLKNNHSFYETFFRLIEPFFLKYKEIVDEARISDNKNILFKYIDKDMYNEYVQILYEIYEQLSKNPNMSIPSSLEERALYLISNMDIVSKEEMTIEEYQELYPEKKLRLLRK